MYKLFTVVSLFMLFVTKSLAQPQNDGCNLAIPLCPNTTISGTNWGATSTVCPNCEDDFTFCFSGENTVWYTLQTNTTGGDLTINLNNIAFNPQVGLGTELQAALVQATIPCDAASYTLISNCVSNATTNITLTAFGLPANTTYYLIVNGAKNGGATAPAEATFDITASGTGFDRLPTGISITGPSYTICPNKPTPINTYVVNCNDTSDFTWYVNGQQRAVTQEAFWITSSLQNGDVVSVSCTCFTNCKDTLTATLSPIIVDSLMVEAGEDVYIHAGESVLLSGTSNGFDFTWYPSELVNTPYSLTTYASPEQTTTYTITALDSFCSISDEVTVHVIDALTIPGSFSPNGDGTNDTWVIEGIEFFPDSNVLIYDRWGQVVADITSYSKAKAWDGTWKGKPLSDGVYFYSLDLRQNNGNKPLKGSVTIIR